jgi:hypothetical protein
MFYLLFTSNYTEIPKKDSGGIEKRPKSQKKDKKI